MKILLKDFKFGKLKVMPEILDDLWHLDKIIRVGDKVKSRTYRSYKPTPTSKPERKPVTIEIEVEKIEFSQHSDSLRVLGPITYGSPEEFVQHGAHHSLIISLASSITITKQKWSNYDLDRLNRAVKDTHKPKLTVIVLDNEKALFANFKNYGIDYGPEIMSHVSKRDSNPQAKKEDFFKNVIDVINNKKVEKIVIAGPGFTKEEIGSYIKDKHSTLYKKITFAKCYSAERNGVAELIKQGTISKVLGDNQIDLESQLIEKLKLSISKNVTDIAYGLPEVKMAIKANAVDNLLVSDKLIREDKEIRNFLDKIEKDVGKLTIFSDDSEPGKQLLALGGIAALLYFKM